MIQMTNRLTRPMENLQLSGLARLEQDVFSVAGITHIVLLEGINDIGQSGNTDPRAVAIWGDYSLTPKSLISAYGQVITRAHIRDIKVICATLLPFSGAAYFTPEKEAIRVAVNDWIRTSGACDGVIDFDAITRDPADPTRLREDYDSGDHLHPSAAGFKAMGEAIDLRLFK